MAFELENYDPNLLLDIYLGGDQLLYKDHLSPKVVISDLPLTYYNHEDYLKSYYFKVKLVSKNTQNKQVAEKTFLFKNKKIFRLPEENYIPTIINVTQTSIDFSIFQNVLGEIANYPGVTDPYKMPEIYGSRGEYFINDNPVSISFEYNCYWREASNYTIENLTPGADYEVKVLVNLNTFVADPL